MENGYRIGELAGKAGVTKRTVHYYISRGLIPPPEGSGVNSIYDDGHLARILLVKRLQDKYLPLEKIRGVMSGLDDSEVAARLESGDDGCADAAVPGAAAASAAVEAAEQGGASLGEAYVRVELGCGLELHCPAGRQQEHAEAIRSIRRYAARLFEEK